MSSTDCETISRSATVGEHMATKRVEDLNLRVQDLRSAAYIVAMDKIAKTYLELGISP